MILKETQVGFFVIVFGLCHECLCDTPCFLCKVFALWIARAGSYVCKLPRAGKGFKLSALILRPLFDTMFSAIQCLAEVAFHLCITAEAVVLWSLSSCHGLSAILCLIMGSLMFEGLNSGQMVLLPTMSSICLFIFGQNRISRVLCLHFLKPVWPVVFGTTEFMQIVRRGWKFSSLWMRYCSFVKAHPNSSNIGAPRTFTALVRPSFLNCLFQLDKLCVHFSFRLDLF